MKNTENEIRLISTKRKALIILLLIIGLITTAVLTVHFTSKKLDLYYWVSIDEYASFEVEFSDPDIAKVEEITSENGATRIRLSSMSAGSTEVKLACTHHAPYNDIKDYFSHSIRVTKTGIMYSSRFSFNGMHAIFAELAFTLLIISILFYYWYRRGRKASFFSYRTIQDLGLSLFFLFQALVVFAALILSSVIREVPLSGENLLSILGLMMSIISLATFPLLFLFSVLLSISNIGLIRREGARPANALGILLSFLLMAGLFGIALLVYLSPSSLSPEETTGYIVMLRSTLSSIFFYFVCILFSTLFHCQRAGKHNPAYDKDYLIILGCGIRDDGTLYPLLQGRADRAIRFYREQLDATGKEACFVPSGGQGPDECMAEGDAIRNYLISKGIPDSRILPETRSVNTLQNMRFSKEILMEHASKEHTEIVTAKEHGENAAAKEHGENASTKGHGENATPNVAFSTTNFHVFRSGILASDEGLNADGMGAKTKWYFWPNALIREFIGLLARKWKVHLIFSVIVVLEGIISADIQILFETFP